MSRIKAVSAVVVLVLLLSAYPASAEWFGDLYLGYSIPAHTDLTLHGDNTTRTFLSASPDSSEILGGRGGYWFDEKTTPALGAVARYVGLALDFSYFHPVIPGQAVRNDAGGITHLGDFDVNVFVLAPLLMLRYPLMVSDEYPRGRLQPYGFIGPSIVINSADDDGANFGFAGRGASDTSLGITVGPGVAWMVTEHVAVFGEYRFVHASPSYGFAAGTVDVPINSHGLIVGVSYRF